MSVADRYRPIPPLPPGVPAPAYPLYTTRAGLVWILIPSKAANPIVQGGYGYTRELYLYQVPVLGTGDH